MIQTWLPLPNFEDSIACLSDEHLGIVRFYVLEVLEALHQPEESQLPLSYDAHDLNDQHPLVKMWKGYDLQLIEYGLISCDEWVARGNVDNTYSCLTVHMEWAATEDADMGKPNWFGDVDFHLGHQAELLRLDSKHYSQHFVRDGDRQLIYPVSSYA